MCCDYGEIDIRRIAYAAKKIEQISLSDDIVRRISHMSLDVKQQVIEEMNASPLFAFQVDESANVALCSQLIVFVQYIHEYYIKNEFLFWTSLKTITNSEDVTEKISIFFDIEGLQWNKLCGICTDGPPAMLGSRSGFQTKVKAKSPQAKGFRCIIHRYALACKTLPISLKEVLNLVIKLVNFVKGSALNSHLFKELCRDMNADHESLLFYCAVRWLSKGNVLCRVFELRKELKEFLRLQKKIFLWLH